MTNLVVKVPKLFLNTLNVISDFFYFEVLHPVAGTLSRLLEEPSLTTTSRVYLYLF
jgi:hypothetical protein